MPDPVIETLRLSKRFTEGLNTLRSGCQCDKCSISRYRHTHEPGLADPGHSYWEYLKFCIQYPYTQGLWLEFGVGSGKSLSFIAQHRPQEIIYGFDSFYGLPEDWALSAEKVYKAASYSRNGVAPLLEQQNITLVTGLFSETLDHFCNAHAGPCAFVHIDCDLYTSTIQVLSILHKHHKIIKGTVILFDEFYNYPLYKDCEYKAFVEFFGSSGLHYEWIAHTDSPVEWNGNQAALVIR